MHRTRQQLVVLVVLGAVPSVALAFHNGAVYDLAPGAGGGGGLFFTGSTRERGWDCTACHVEPRGTLRVDVTSQPAELITAQRYTPNTSYMITVAMAEPGKQLGLSATRSNFNSMVVTVLDDAGNSAGTISGFDPGKFYARGGAILASDSTTVNETTWSFTWTAPASGAAMINIAVVDGNGANATTQTLTDPLDDDVFTLGLRVTDGAATRALQWSVGELLSLCRWIASQTLHRRSGSDAAT